MMVLFALSAFAFETADNGHLELKWVRDSEEYAALTTATYQAATHAVLSSRSRGRQPWAVVLDIDETVLDNSPYFLERAAYGQRFDWPSWDAWCERRTAEAIPGALAFVQAVREAGGRVAWVSNRHERTRSSTIDNLALHGLYDSADRVCLLTDDDAYDKRTRRTQLREGGGACGWDDAVDIRAYFGDTMADLPEASELEGARSTLLGSVTWVLPNPTYGSWEHGVTRPELIVR